MLLRLRNLWFSLGLAATSLWPQFARGQVEINCGNGETEVGGTCVPTGGALSEINTLTGLINIILSVLLVMVGLVAIVYLVIGGYKYITASGDEEQLKSAKGTILNSLIGLAIVLLAFALVRIIANAVIGNV